MGVTILTRCSLTPDRARREVHQVKSRMIHFAIAVAALVVVTGCGDDEDKGSDEACMVAALEGHDAYYEAYCED